MVTRTPSPAPQSRFVAAGAEGQFNAERRRNIVAEITTAVLDAERGAHDRDAGRLWVLTSEIPEGTRGDPAALGC